MNEENLTDVNAGDIIIEENVTESKLYSKADVDSIVNKAVENRLSRERKKNSGSHEKIAELEDKLARYEAINSVISAGVPAEFAEDVVCLAKKYCGDETDFSSAISMVTEKYPIFSGAKNKVNTGVKTSNSPVDEIDGVTKKFLEKNPKLVGKI